MYFVQGFDRLDLYNDTFLHQYVGDKVSHQNFPVTNFDSALLGYRKATMCEFHSQRIFVDFFKKSSAEDVAYLMNAADDLFRNLIQPRSAFIGVHRRLKQRFPSESALLAFDADPESLGHVVESHQLEAFQYFRQPSDTGKQNVQRGNYFAAPVRRRSNRFAKNTFGYARDFRGIHDQGGSLDAEAGIEFLRRFADRFLAGERHDYTRGDHLQ
jgi:hypothetical protein